MTSFLYKLKHKNTLEYFFIFNEIILIVYVFKKSSFKFVRFRLSYIFITFNLLRLNKFC